MDAPSQKARRLKNKLQQIEQKFIDSFNEVTILARELQRAGYNKAIFDAHTEKAAVVQFLKSLKKNIQSMESDN